MLTLFDMIEQAQGGAARDNLANQFGLSQDQVDEALAALMPAFAAALRHNTRQPQDLMGFMSALGTGQHAKYYEDAMAAFSGGREEGDAILGHMFGSKEASRAIAAQAAQATGIGQEIFRQMLPVVASMVMGGLFKQSAGGGAAPGGGFLGQFMEQIMSGLAALSPQTGGKARQPENPFGDILEQMMGGGIRPGGGHAAPPPGAGAAVPSGADIFGPMFDAGREVQDGYARGMERIVEGYLRGMDRPR